MEVLQHISKPGELLNYSIVNPDNEHYSQVIEISDVQLGSGYLSLEDLNTNRKSFLNVAVTNDLVIGFCLGYFESAFSRKTNEDNGSQVGMIKSVAVRPEFVGRGVGTGLIQNALGTFKTYDINNVDCLVWKRADTRGLVGILARTDFYQADEFKEYWKEESLTNQFFCPECGEPPCYCKALLFKKILKAEV